jgi:hypothetical protein
MAARKVYRVVPGGGMWNLKHDGTTLKSFYTKAAAVDEGRRAAKANQPSQLVVHRADGTIEEEFTYGDDPYPPRG